MGLFEIAVRFVADLAVKGDEQFIAVFVNHFEFGKRILKPS